MKKYAAALVGVIISLMFTGVSTVDSSQYRDVPDSHPNAGAIHFLSYFEVFRGQGDGGVFSPDAPINRAEFAVILSRYTGAELPTPSLRFCFPDVGDSWYSNAVCHAKDQGWIKGYQAGPEAGKFMPVNPLMAGEVVVILDRVLDWGSSSGGEWYTGAMALADRTNLLRGVPFDRPLTRAQVAEILFRANVLKKMEVEIYDPFLGEEFLKSANISIPDLQVPLQESPPQIIGTLSAFGTQPEGFTIPKGSTNVSVLRFQVEVDAPTFLEELSVTRSQPGSFRNIDEGRLVVGQKVHRSTAGSGDRGELTWRSLHISLSSGVPTVFEVLIDFAEDSESISFHAFSIAPDQLVFSSAGESVSGQKIQGGIFQVLTLPVTTVTVKNPTGILKIPSVDSTNQIVARFIIQAGKNPVLVKRIRLREDGDINNSALSNFTLSAGNESLAIQEFMDRNTLDFLTPEHLIEEEESRTFTLRADISSVADISDNIRFYVDDETDIFVLDSLYAIGARVINQFDRVTAKCVGSSTVQCPDLGLRRKCTREDREEGVEECLQQEASESEAPPALSCSSNFSTVCGSLNGIRRPFPNQCDAEQQEATSITAGTCNAALCDSTPAPVCGRVFGGQVRRTFLNRCHAEEYRAITIIDGPCRDEDRVCTAEFEPVCGSVSVQCLTDNCSPVRQTFSNECEAQRAGITTFSQGECN